MEIHVSEHENLLLFSISIFYNKVMHDFKNKVCPGTGARALEIEKISNKTISNNYTLSKVVYYGHAILFFFFGKNYVMRTTYYLVCTTYIVRAT